MTCLMDAAQTGLLAPATNDVVQWHICTFENQQVVQWHPVASPAEDVPYIAVGICKMLCAEQLHGLLYGVCGSSCTAETVERSCNSITEWTQL